MTEKNWFIGGGNLEYTIMPMLGGVVGLTNGIAPGLEFIFSYNRFELSNASEYVFDFKSKENNYLYSWVDLTYSLHENLFLGISSQRTRLFKTDLDIQRGLILGGS